MLRLLSSLRPPPPPSHCEYRVPFRNKGARLESERASIRAPCQEQGPPNPPFQASVLITVAQDCLPMLLGLDRLKKDYYKTDEIYGVTLESQHHTINTFQNGTGSEEGI